MPHIKIVSVSAPTGPASVADKRLRPGLFCTLFCVLVCPPALLAACGFTPLYDHGFGGASGAFAVIDIAPIPERLGQLVRARLKERFGAARGSAGESAGESRGEADYELTVELKTDSFQFGLRGADPITGARGDAAATQEEITLTTRYHLTRKADDAIIFSHEIVLGSSFDLVLSDFAIVATREDTQKRLALETVERIERRLALFFRNQAKERTNSAPGTG